MRVAAFRKAFAAGVLLATVSVISACTQTPPPPPAPKAPQFTHRPYPPMGAAPNLSIPQVGVDGTRLTINRGLSTDQTVWNLRSAYNVAALNCSRANHATLVDSYGNFLKKHSRALASANRALDQNFKSSYGAKYIAAREGFQTQVYNYFALPPVLPSFCDEMIAVGQELAEVPAGQLETYSPNALARLENVFLDFFNRYDAYRRDFAQWQLDFRAKYGTPPPAGYFLPGETPIQAQPVAVEPVEPAESATVGG